MKNKKVVTILSIFAVIITVIGGTFAYWRWTTSEEQRTLVTFSVADNFSCSVDGGGNITSDTYTVAPASCANSKYAIKREVTTTVEVTGNEPVTMDLVININNLGTGLTNSENFMYALTKSSYDCSTDIISQGTFNKKTNGNTISILNKTYESTTTETYYLWIWLDSIEKSSATKNQPFNLSLGGTCTDTPMDYFYAVYSSTDYSLRFYDGTETEIRSRYEGQDRDIDAMYKVYNNAVYTRQNLPPWNEYASDIEYVAVENTISPSNTQYWFYNFNNVSTMNLTKLNTSNVISMAYMFYNMYEDFEPIGLSNWDTSNVKNMAYMFYETGDSIFDLGNVSEWDTSNVMNMQGMFESTAENTEFSVDMTLWDVSNVRDMSRMFYYCGGSDFYIGNLDDWNTSKVKNMSYMFNGAGFSAANFFLDLSGWDVSSVTNMDYMFCSTGFSANTFSIGNISGWNTYSVTNMDSMFNSAGYSATNFFLDLSGWNVSNVTNHTMFNLLVESKITLPLAWQS